MLDFPRNLTNTGNTGFLQTPILMVDDRRDNLDLLDDLLRDAGHTHLLPVESGQEALELLAARPDIGLVLLDLQMPGMDGCATCRAICGDKRTAHIPVIMVTGGTLDRDDALVQSFEAGVIDFISKPLHELELHGRVRSALALYHERMALRKQTEALRASEERFRFAVSGVNDGVWDLNLANGTAFLSPNWKRNLGYEDGELANTVETWKRFVHPEDLGDFEEALDRHWQRPESIFSLEHRLTHRDGSVLWVLSRGTTLRDKAGNAVRMCGSTADLTRQKQLETQLRHSQKMECVGRFAGGVAHDFNNIVSLISGYSEVILSQMDQSEKVLRYTRQILQASDRAATLARQLLTLSHKAPAKMAPLHVGEALAPLKEVLHHILGPRIELTLDTGDSTAILADRGMIEQVILNLVINARDAMPDGGRLLISVSRAETVEGDGDDPKTALRLRFADTGSGMNDDTLSRLFEPFFTTKKEGHGTGLGLSTVYSILKIHQGWIDVKSEVNRGTTFDLYFPISSHAMQTTSGTGQSTPPSREHGILLVEDEEALREMTRMVLAGHRFKVWEAASGPHALEVWKRHQEEIDVLFTDIVMPEGMTGGDIGEKCRGEKPGLKIIYTSGYQLSTLPKADLIEKNGIFIAKPYVPSKVAKMIREMFSE